MNTENTVTKFVSLPKDEEFDAIQFENLQGFYTLCESHTFY